MQTARDCGAFKEFEREAVVPPGDSGSQLESPFWPELAKSFRGPFGGHFDTSGSETNYLDATHWAAILDDIRDIRVSLKLTPPRVKETRRALFPAALTLYLT